MLPKPIEEPIAANKKAPYEPQEGRLAVALDVDFSLDKFFYVVLGATAVLSSA